MIRSDNTGVTAVRTNSGATSFYTAGNKPALLGFILANCGCDRPAEHLHVSPVFGGPADVTTEEDAIAALLEAAAAPRPAMVDATTEWLAGAGADLASQEFKQAHQNALAVLASAAA